MSSRGSDPHQDLVTQLCVNGLPDPSVTGENRTQYPEFTILTNTAQQTFNFIFNHGIYPNKYITADQTSISEILIIPLITNSNFLNPKIP
jgi:hypothetical protein